LAEIDGDYNSPVFTLLTSPEWKDYELLDSGGGKKLERYGDYIFERPEPQALWEPSLPQSQWNAAHAIFQPTGGESGGRWKFTKTIHSPWVMNYKDLRFHAFASRSRHMGVFPEQANHWDWICMRIENSRNPVRVLNLFAYTGLATLAAAKAGAYVTHVDASKRSISIARQNQSLSGLSDRPIRWLIDDVTKFVRREVHRGSKYEALILDPPKFGRGSQGQVWDFYKSMPHLLKACRLLISDKPLFVVLTAYAIHASSFSLFTALQEMFSDLGGTLSCGELALVERSAGRIISTAIYARWSAISGDNL